MVVRIMPWCLILMLVLAACAADEDDSSTEAGQADDDNDASPADDDAADDDVADDDSAADDDDTALDQFITEKMQQAHLPGLAVGIVKDGELIWTKGYGWAKIEDEIPVTPATLFQLASVSKTVTATALMQVYDDGGFALDDAINDYLPFAVVNPRAPDKAITFRQLLTHTSSIRDNWLEIVPLYCAGDSPLPLGQFLEDYLTPDGAYYNSLLNYYFYEPGEKWNYSNIGATTAGYLVEAITEQPFDEFCQDRIFAPLAMDETSWRLAGLDRDHVAMPYRYDAETDGYIAYGYYGYPDYPDGLLRTSVEQLARFLLAFMNEGEYRGERILERETALMMRLPQVPELDPTQALTWYYKVQGGRTLLGHNGGEDGVATEMFFSPEENTGVILLMNGNWTSDNYELILEVENRLYAQAEQKPAR